VRLRRLNLATRKGLRVPPFLRECSLQHREQSFDFTPNKIANGAKFFRRAIFEGGSAAPPDDAK
jgi:hypothetical protein